VVEQQEGRQYLNRMVEAQKLFYQKNQQLAQSLEELERSAAVVSHSYNYTYRVTTATPTQFQLAAIARISTLKSYAAIVSLPEPAGRLPQSSAKPVSLPRFRRSCPELLSIRFSALLALSRFRRVAFC
jgi:hypothetical protein